MMLLIVAFSGCGSDGLPLAPVQGKVLYRGKPLQFGSVVFQPESGRPATGIVQPDGSFTLTTYQKDDGAQIGAHKVIVLCYEGQRHASTGAPASEVAGGLGKLLIPERYTYFHESGLKAVVEKNTPSITFELQ
jgi:hypothetical protein